MSKSAQAECAAESQHVGPKNPTLCVFLISVLALFLELMLIRWIGTEVRIFAYLQNTVLIVCFLGLGMGCFVCHKPIRLTRSLAALLILTTILAVPVTRGVFARITDLLSVLSDFLIWGAAISEGLWITVLRVGLGLSLVLVMMVLIWEVFVPLGQILGRSMDQHPHTIRAYSTNVVGSLIGIWLFVGLSSFWLLPWVWLAVAAILTLPFLTSAKERFRQVGTLAGVVVAGVVACYEPNAMQVVWSPYQKLVLTNNVTHRSKWSGDYLISVNNTCYQGIIDLSEGSAARQQVPEQLRGLSQYDIPAMLHDNPSEALLVGAGSGNDVAGALRQGCERVTAVDIDPAIIEMGREHHPERPYQDPRVTVVNDDARSYFANTDRQFDLIVFGLLDSHTTTAMTNARLDHYVYTEESLRHVRSLLADGGVVVLSFEAAKPYIADRMGSCLQKVFGQEPIVFRIPPSKIGWGGVMFICGDLNRVQKQLNAQPELAALIDKWKAMEPMQLAGATEIATDDWPYIYLESRRIPNLYFLLAGLLFVLFGYARYRLQTPVLGSRWTRGEWHFFFLGAAFLLLEVQNISKAAVTLGNTWAVNAVIISGILGMILLANLVTAWFPRLSLRLVGTCLIGCCLTLYWVDIADFGFLPYLPKAILVGASTTLPLFFAGILFIRSFKDVERKDVALGANLMGSIVGGVLQSVSFIIGIKGLLLIVTALYLIALALRPRINKGSEASQGVADDPYDLLPDLRGQEGSPPVQDLVQV
jgi:spermidine synthase